MRWGVLVDIKHPVNMWQSWALPPRPGSVHCTHHHPSSFAGGWVGIGGKSVMWLTHCLKKKKWAPFLAQVWTFLAASKKGFWEEPDEEMRSIYGLDKCQKEQWACLRKKWWEIREGVWGERDKSRVDGEREVGSRNVSSLDPETVESERVRFCEREIG